MVENSQLCICTPHTKEILELHSNGLGTRKIEKYIKEKYHKKISHATIYNFIKAQKKEEENNG